VGAAGASDNTDDEATDCGATNCMSSTVGDFVAGRLSSNTLNLYVNGSLDSCTDTATTGITANNNDFQLFRRNGGTTSDNLVGVWADEAFLFRDNLTDAALCRICSCGWSNHRNCYCDVGGSWAANGRGVNATLCGSCVLPTSCTATRPDCVGGACAL
jgi:hypothetical protein